MHYYYILKLCIFPLRFYSLIVFPYCFLFKLIPFSSFALPSTTEAKVSSHIGGTPPPKKHSKKIYLLLNKIEQKTNTQQQQQKKKKKKNEQGGKHNESHQ